MSRSLLVPLVLVALVLSGCSQDDEKSPKDKSAKAMESLVSILAGNSPSAEQARASSCLAEQIVRDAGVDALVDAGVLTEELTTPKSGTASLGGSIGEVYVDALLVCRDVRAEFAVRKDDYPNLTAKREQRYLDCASGIDPSVLRPALLAGLSGTRDEAAAGARQAYVDAMAGCEKILGKPAVD